jgi:hypothetical protein
MHVKVIQSCAINGEHCEEGELLELEDADARQMVAYGRVREATKREIADAQKRPSAPSTPPPGGSGDNESKA